MQKEVIEILQNIQSIKKELSNYKFQKKEIDRTKRRLKTLRDKYYFINEIIGIDKKGKRLEKFVTKFFKKIGYNNVRHIGNSKNKPDILIETEYKNKRIDVYVEVTGTDKPIPGIPKCNQIRDELNNIDNKNENENINAKTHGVFIINHENNKPYNERGYPFDYIRKVQAEKNKLTFVTTIDLVKFFILIDNGDMSFHEFHKKLLTNGLMKCNNFNI